MNNINILYMLIISFLILTYPILLNTMLLAYKKIFNDKTLSVILDINILISFYFILEINQLFNQYYFYVIYFIPLLIAYLYKKEILVLILSLCTLETLYSITNPYLLVFFLITYYLVYIIVENKSKNKECFCTIFYILTSMFIILNFIIHGKFKHSFFLNFVLLLITTFILVKLVLFILVKTEKILTTFLSFKEIEKEKQIRTSLFKITHEIKNPIAVIKGYLDMFDINEKSNEKYIQIMKSEVQRTLSILNDFSNLKNIKIKKDMMDCTLLIDDLKFLLLPYLNKNDIVYEFEYLNELYINADYDRLKQVLINVMKNSIEALINRDNKKIILRNYVKDNYIVFCIKDNGCGMDKHTLENVFNHFYTTKPEGTGLGLVLSKEIIESHNGKICINTKKDKGTTTYIYLPKF